MLSTRTKTKFTRFANVLKEHMRMSPGGQMSITELSERTGMPRSTIHRHLKGGMPLPSAVARYAEVFGIPRNEFAILAGFPAMNDEEELMDAWTLAMQLMRLDQETRDLIRQLAIAVEAPKKRKEAYTQQEGTEMGVVHLQQDVRQQ